MKYCGATTLLHRHQAIWLHNVGHVLPNNCYHQNTQTKPPQTNSVFIKVSLNIACESITTMAVDVQLLSIMPEWPVCVSILKVIKICTRLFPRQGVWPGYYASCIQCIGFLLVPGTHRLSTHSARLFRGRRK